MTVPEAPIYKNGGTILPHHDIRLPWHALHVEPIAIAVLPQPLPHLQLGLGAFAVNARHHKVTLGGSENIGHLLFQFVKYFFICRQPIHAAELVVEQYLPFFSPICL